MYKWNRTVLQKESFLQMENDNKSENLNKRK